MQSCSECPSVLACMASLHLAAKTSGCRAICRIFCQSDSLNLNPGSLKSIHALTLLLQTAMHAADLVKDRLRTSPRGPLSNAALYPGFSRLMARLNAVPSPIKEAHQACSAPRLGQAAKPVLPQSSTGGAAGAGKELRFRNPEYSCKKPSMQVYERDFAQAHVSLPRSLPVCSALKVAMCCPGQLHQAQAAAR
jgi:hypothetical protein